MRTYLLSNPNYRPQKPLSLPLWFTLNDLAKAVGIRRNSMLYYVEAKRLVPRARTASGLDLFAETEANKFLAWHRGRTKRKGKK